MEITIIYCALVILGLCMGSFAGAMVWRLRAHQLAQDKLDGEPVDDGEYTKLKKLTGLSVRKDRSLCIHCSYALKWYDMIPIISWLSLRGKCRKCRTPIGWLEPLIELGVATFFVLSYIFWPYALNNGLEIARLVLWLAAGVGLAILFAYDAKWFLLPDRVSIVVIGIGIVSAFLVVLGAQDQIGTLYSIVGSAFILSGLYLSLYLISRGKWIGFGDIKLGLGLALLLADWKLAFIALFVANLIGCLIVIPAMIMGKLKRNSHVPFGPLLIIGSIIAMLAGNYLINMFFYSVL